MRVLFLVASCSSLLSIAHAFLNNTRNIDLGCCEFERYSNEKFEKRGLCKNLACIRKNMKSEEAYEPVNFTKPEQAACLAQFEAAYSEIKADALSAGDEAAYDSMRDQLIMILNNLRVVHKQIGDTDAMDVLSPEELRQVLQSAKATYISCKTHFEAFQPRDWQWFFLMASAQNGILKDRHRKIFLCHFDLIRGNMKFIAKHYGVPDMDNF